MLLDSVVSDCVWACPFPVIFQGVCVDCVFLQCYVQSGTSSYYDIVCYIVMFIVFISLLSSVLWSVILECSFLVLVYLVFVVVVVRVCVVFKCLFLLCYG